MSAPMRRTSTGPAPALGPPFPNGRSPAVAADRPQMTGTLARLRRAPGTCRPAPVAMARKGLAATASAMARLQGRPMAAAALAHRLTPPLASVPVAAIGTRADAAPAPVPSAAPTTCPARDAGLRAAPAGPLASLRSAAAAQCPRDRQLPAPAPTASALEQARSLA